MTFAGGKGSQVGLNGMQKRVVPSGLTSSKGEGKVNSGRKSIHLNAEHEEGRPITGSSIKKFKKNEKRPPARHSAARGKKKGAMYPAGKEKKEKIAHQTEKENSGCHFVRKGEAKRDNEGKKNASGAVAKLGQEVATALVCVEKRAFVTLPQL